MPPLEGLPAPLLDVGYPPPEGPPLLACERGLVAELLFPPFAATLISIMCGIESFTLTSIRANALEFSPVV